MGMETDLLQSWKRIVESSTHHRNIPQMTRKLGIQALSTDKEKSIPGMEKESVWVWGKDLELNYLEKGDFVESDYNPP